MTLAWLASLLIRPYLEPDAFLLFLVAVWLSAWYYGRAIGFVDNPSGSYSQLQTLTIEEFREHQTGHRT